jgi:hypothetical protein
MRAVVAMARMAMARGMVRRRATEAEEEMRALAR